MVHDATVVGGSFAGLSAALYIARGQRSVCVIDAGAPRNRFAAHAHGLFALDGDAPAALLARARAQVASYPKVTFIQAQAHEARSDSETFSVALKSGEQVESRRLVLAFGISDELPQVPGLAERWGSSVLHCPYCHGHELRGRRQGVLMLSPRSLHQALLISEWGPTTLYLNGGDVPDEAGLARLRERGVRIEPGRVTALHGDGARLSEIELADGRRSEVEALYIAPRTHLNSGIAAELGCETEDGIFGPVIRTDPLKRTNVPGVFAAGDITRSAHNVTWATADGVTAGVAVHQSLVF